MTITELIKELQKKEVAGFGHIAIHVEDGQETCSIDSIQKNTMPQVEPDYFFIMAGDIIPGL